MREDRLKVFASFVTDLASLSRCEDRKVAAIITDKGLSQVYSIGINGGPKGLDQCLCHTEGKYGCIHAEINALIKCTSTAKDKVMIVTLAPCKQCAAAIVNSGFSAVYYLNNWERSSHGIDILKNAGVKVWYAGS